jgi:hypothetical protein
MWKGPYYDKFRCHKLEEGNFRTRKILQSFQLSKSQIPCSHRDGSVKPPNALLCREDSDISACIHLDVKETCSDTALIMETYEALYGKAVAQFTSGRSMTPSGSQLEKFESVAI